ncbi:MAG: hypothetical protein ACOX8K_00815 [Lachnospiraceae bacterium]
MEMVQIQRYLLAQPCLRKKHRSSSDDPWREGRDYRRLNNYIKIKKEDDRSYEADSRTFREIESIDGRA